RSKLQALSEPPFDPSHTHVALALLAMCAAQYFTVLESDRGLHFYFGSVLLFAALTYLLVTLVRRNAGLAVAGVAVGPTREKSPPRRANVKRPRRAGSAEDAAQ